MSYNEADKKVMDTRTMYVNLGKLVIVVAFLVVLAVGFGVFLLIH